MYDLIKRYMLDPKVVIASTDLTACATYTLKTTCQNFIRKPIPAEKNEERKEEKKGKKPEIINYDSSQLC